MGRRGGGGETKSFISFLPLFFLPTPLLRSLLAPPPARRKLLRRRRGKKKRKGGRDEEGEKEKESDGVGGPSFLPSSLPLGVCGRGRRTGGQANKKE